MNYPFSKKTSLHRMVSLSLVLLLMLSMLSGCSLLPARQPSETAEPIIVDTEPSTETPTVETESTVPTTVETVPPTAEAPKENVAIVREQTHLRSNPSTGGRVITTLDAGEEVEVARVDSVGTVKWAFVSCNSLGVVGWVVTDMLDMSNVTLESNSTDTPASGNGPTVPTNAPTVPTTPETTPVPVDPITGTGSNTSTANGKMGVITASDLNIRDAASQSGNRVGSYNYGTRVSILETKDGWGRTDKGWISLNYVYMDGNTGTNTASGTVTASQLNVRSGPSSAYDKVSSLNQGARVQILEQIKSGAETWGYTNGGWVNMQYIAVDGASGNAGMGGNTTPSTTTGTATVTGNGLNVRNGAGTGYNIVGALNQGDVVTILETTTADGMQWGRISQGWICLNYVRMN